MVVSNHLADSDVSSHCGSETEPGELRIRLRQDLKSSLRQQGARPFVLIEDPLRSSFFRMGINEWQLACTLDGNQTLTQVIHQFVTNRGVQTEFTASEVVQFARWLIQNGLAEAITGNNPAPADLSQRHQRLQKQIGLQRWSNWNPLFIKIPFPSPDPWLRQVYPWVKPIFSSHFLWLWLVTCSWAAYRLLARFTEFRSTWNEVIAAENWLYLLVTWVLLKVLHELSHALACIHFGGHVPRCGLMLIVFSPVAFVDVTSAWSFRSKWQRIFVSAAGMYAECFIAALAAVVWSMTDDGVLSGLSRNVVMAASVSTLIFNANFLMRFDGYYILGDLLSVQNLYGTAQQYMRYFGRRYVLGLPSSPPYISPAHRLLVPIYGWASLVWRWLFYFGMILVAATLFHGAGIVLALFSALVWIAGPAYQFVVYLIYGRGKEQPNRLHFLKVAITSTFLCGVSLLFPWPGNTSAPGVIEYDVLEPVRVNSPGFVKRVLVDDGQLVQANQLLLELSNPDLLNELDALQLQYQRLDIERRGLQRNHETDQVAIIGRRMESTDQQIQQLKTKVAALEVRAPITGQIIGRRLDDLDGVYAETGRLLFSVGQGNAKVVHAAVRQTDMGPFREKEGEPVRIRVSGRPFSVYWGILARTNPKATHAIPHHALTATLGGPLAVRRRETMRQEPGDHPEDSMELAVPHFEATALLTLGDSDLLRAGERCQLYLGRGQFTIGAKLLETVREFFLRKTGQ